MVATHFWAFTLALLGVILPIVSVLLIRLFKGLNLSASYVTNDGIATTVLQLCFAVYLFVMFYRSYLVSRWYAALTAISISWSFFHIVWLYRFFLFELTLGTV